MVCVPLALTYMDQSGCPCRQHKVGLYTPRAVAITLLSFLMGVARSELSYVRLLSVLPALRPRLHLSHVHTTLCVSKVLWGTS